MFTLASLAMLVVFIIVAGVVLSLLYFAITRIPIFAGYLWAFQALFAVLAALAIIGWFSSGGNIDSFKLR